MATISEWLSTAKQRLLAAGLVEDSTLSAQVLLSEVYGKPRAWLLAHPEMPIAQAQTLQLQDALERLLAGVPLPYLIGRQSFYTLDFEVSPAVLIPRPETELLVEQALAWMHAHPGCRTADVGCGSGAIAISLAHHCADAQIIAVDQSWDALQITRRNAARYHLESRIHLLQSDLLSAVNGPLNLVCANLPYIPSAVVDQLAVVRYEPRLALDGGPDGLRWIAALLADSPRWMAPGGALLLEIEAGQGGSAPELALQYWPLARVQVINDLADLPRLLSIQLPAA